MSLLCRQDKVESCSRGCAGYNSVLEFVFKGFSFKSSAAGTATGINNNTSNLISGHRSLTTL